MDDLQQVATYRGFGNCLDNHEEAVHSHAIYTNCHIDHLIVLEMVIVNVCC